MTLIRLMWICKKHSTASPRYFDGATSRCAGGLPSKAVWGLVFPPKSPSLATDCPPLCRATLILRPRAVYRRSGFRFRSASLSPGHSARTARHRHCASFMVAAFSGKLGQVAPGDVAIDPLIDACKFLRRRSERTRRQAPVGQAHLTHLIAGLRGLGQQCPASFRSPGRPYPAVYPAEVRGRRGSPAVGIARPT